MIHLYANKNYTQLSRKTTVNVGDIITCIEDRQVSNVDVRSGLKSYIQDETYTFLTHGKEYEVIDIKPRKRKVGIIGNDGKKKYVTYERMAFKVSDD